MVDCDFRNDHLCNALALSDVNVEKVRWLKFLSKLQRGQGYLFIAWERLQALTFHQPQAKIEYRMPALSQGHTAIAEST